MEIDLNIEKEITKLQEAKMHGNLKKVVPEDFDIQLGAFFSTIAEEKKDLKEKVEKDTEKIQAFEKLFTDLTAKKKEVKKKKVLLLEPEEVVNEIRVAEEEAAGSIMEYLLPKEVAEYDEDIISQVSKQISEMQVATELDKDKIKGLESIDSLDKLKTEFINFKDIVAHQLGSLGGGGETQLKYLDDVDTSSALIDKRVLQYDSATGKFVGTTLETEDLILNGTDASGSNAGDRLVFDGTDSSSSNAGDGIDLQDGTFGTPVDLSAVDQSIVPSLTNTYNLGSSSLRFNDLFLAGDTIDLAGSTISADGTGTISISADGVTLPVGSKVGTTAIAQAADNGQTSTDVLFYSAAGGLSTANATFQFASVGDSYSFTTSGTFTMADGESLESQAVQIFKF
jgi:hypothetical protein